MCRAGRSATNGKAMSFPSDVLPSATMPVPPLERSVVYEPNGPNNAYNSPSLYSCLSVARNFWNSRVVHISHCIVTIRQPDSVPIAENLRVITNVFSRKRAVYELIGCTNYYKFYGTHMWRCGWFGIMCGDKASKPRLWLITASLARLQTVAFLLACFQRFSWTICKGTHTSEQPLHTNQEQHTNKPVQCTPIVCCVKVL